MGIKTVHHPPYSPDLAPCDFWLFSKLRGCRYETTEKMKEAVTKVIDTLTQEEFHGVLQKLLQRNNKCIATGGDYFWKSNLSDKMKRSFFQAAVVSILLYGCTTWTLTKRLEKKLDGNYTRMLRAILNKTWR